MIINVKANLKDKYWFGGSNCDAKQIYNRCCREEAKIVARLKLSDARCEKIVKKKELEKENRKKKLKQHND